GIEGRTGERGPVLVELNRRRFVELAIGRLLRRLERRDVVVDVHVERNRGGGSVHRQRPRELLRLWKFLRDRDREHAEAAPGKKMRRLAHIGRPWVEVVVGADRDIDFLLGVPTVIPDEEGMSAVWIIVPAFKRGTDAGAELLGRIAGQLHLRRY